MAHKAELDLEDARRRLAEAAGTAKELEESGRGFEANAAWERFQLISNAIAAHERRSGEHAA